MRSRAVADIDFTESEGVIMKVFLGLIAASVLFGCAAKMPEKPRYKTSSGEECAADCERDYSDCLASEIRPDYLVFSPRKKACQNLIRGCYQLCSEKEKQKPSTSSQ
jgi:hypothetical protein